MSELAPIFFLAEADSAQRKVGLVAEETLLIRLYSYQKDGEVRKRREIGAVVGVVSEGKLSISISLDTKYPGPTRLNATFDLGDEP